jgi:hypothetical protein
MMKLGEEQPTFGSAYCYTVRNLLRFRPLSKTLKTRIYKTVLASYFVCV